jgi:membrane-bound lytic murein transglycosylase D
MRRPLLALAFGALAVLPARGLLAAPSDEEPVEDNVEADPEPQRVREILDHDLPDSSEALSNDVDRWVLRDLLLQGLAMQRPETAPGGMGAPGGPGAGAGAGAAAPALPAQSLPERPTELADALGQARLIARLRGVPEQHHLQDSAALRFDIPLASHPLVDLYIDYFSGRGRWFFAKWLERSRRFIPMMRPILERAGVPQDLVYVAMIESGFSASAYSTAAAAGYWQFIGPTGKLYGLSHTLWIDERRDFERATQAAARYLGALYREMGDWHLAWACYNAGEGRIRRALAKYHTHDFWQLIAYPKSLAKETMHYVPKVIAAAMIAKNPERYGFTNLQAQAPLHYDSIPIHGAIDLRILAQRSQISIDTLRELNPALLHDITPPHQSTALRVPQTHGPRVAALVARLPENRRLAYQQVKVVRGDTLFGLARRYRADLQAMRDINRLKTSRLMPGQLLVIPSLPPGTGRSRAKLVQARASAAATAATTLRRNRRGTTLGHMRAHAGRNRHVVVHGETLWSIARRYGVSVDRIKRNRRGPRILAGDVLEIM